MPEPVRVYVVDDEPVIATTLAAILNASGFQATAYTSAEDAIKASECEGGWQWTTELLTVTHLN
jgi:FixJ family two-component response regulator